MPMKRPASSSSLPGGSGLFVGDAAELREFPRLLEFLTEPVWEDGSPRQTGTILLFLDEGRLKACLAERSLGLVAFVTGPSLLGLLVEVEAVLRDGKADWRASKGQSARRR